MNKVFSRKVDFLVEALMRPRFENLCSAEFSEDFSLPRLRRFVFAQIPVPKTKKILGLALGKIGKRTVFHQIQIEM